MVSYDGVATIRTLYSFARRREYTIGYSPRRRTRGHEVMCFSKGMKVPELVPPMRKAPRRCTDTRAGSSIGAEA